MGQAFIPFHIPSIGEQEINQVVEVLRSGWLTTGATVKRFEQEFAAYVGARHAIAVNSGTAALHLGLAAADVGDGDEVILPTMTFAATAEVVLHQRAKPILVDCEKESLNLDTLHLESLITPRTKAIMPVHYGGRSCDMNAIFALAEKHKLRVIEDAAHALPCSAEGRMVGSRGDMTCFSFYATKTLTTGEGGMITTDSDADAETMRILSLHGISKDAWKRYQSDGSWYYEIVRAGYKYNLTDVAAAIGLPQLANCDTFQEARQRIANIYDAEFRDLPAVNTPPIPLDERHAWHLYVIQLNLEDWGGTRANFVEGLKNHGVGSSVHFIPLHLHPYYRQRFGYSPNDFPVANDTYQRIVSLPIYPSMSDEVIDRVVKTVKKVITECKAP